ncbi:MAG: amidohydrolase, partial [Planctomycetes bacterium]|nr:amidohydrolase [Planctomycetota bacterium]
MSDPVAAGILDRLEVATFVDPHSHIDPHAPAARSLADILGYHYYTEL